MLKQRTAIALSLQQTAAAIACTLLAACANQNSIFRTQDTQPSKVETILIDAKQRPITVNTVTDPQHPKICLGRNADALSQAAASGNLKFTAPNGAGGELGAAEAEQVTSIAFRTQVTEAQQEYVYYLCQLNANGSLSNEDVSDNLRHFQNTMLAMIAVDDLATSVKSSTPTPDTKNADSTTPPATPQTPGATQSAINNDQSGVTSAKNAANSAEKQVTSSLKAVKAATTANAKSLSDKLTKELKTYDTKEKSYASAIAKLRKDVKTAADAKATEPSDLTQASTASDNAAAKIKSDLSDVNTAVSAVGSAADAATLSSAQMTLDTKYGVYQTDDTTYENALDTLATAVNSWATSSSQATAKDTTGKDTGSSPASPSAAVANDVAIIVQTVVWQSFTTEKCLKALFAGSTINLDPQVIKFCIKHLEDADTLRFKTVQQMSGNGPTQPQQPLAPNLLSQPLQGEGATSDFNTPASPQKR